MELGEVGTSASPNRDEIVHKWREVINRALSREELHAWADPLDAQGWSTDEMVKVGLAVLNAYDLVRDPDDPSNVRHGAPGEYVRSIEEIEIDLAKWMTLCSHYDSDPGSYRARNRSRTLSPEELELRETAKSEARERRHIQ